MNSGRMSIVGGNEFYFEDEDEEMKKEVTITPGIGKGKDIKEEPKRDSMKKEGSSNNGAEDRPRSNKKLRFDAVAKEIDLTKNVEHKYNIGNELFNERRLYSHKGYSYYYSFYIILLFINY